MDNEKAEVYDAVQGIMRQIDTDETELMKRPSPYKRIATNVNFKGKVKRYIPNIVFELKAFWEGQKDREGFIK